MKSSLSLTLPALLLSVACSSTPEPAPPARPTVSIAPASVEEATPEEADVEEEELRRHVVSFFLGGAANQDDEHGLAFGADYEYKLNEHWGAGVFVEGATGDLRSFVGGLLAFYHPIEPLGIVAGPGLERERGNEFGDAEWSGILRLGGFYEFPLGGRWVLAPAAYYDISEHANTFIYGLNLGFSY